MFGFHVDQILELDSRILMVWLLCAVLVGFLLTSIVDTIFQSSSLRPNRLMILYHRILHRIHPVLVMPVLRPRVAPVGYTMRPPPIQPKMVFALLRVKAGRGHKTQLLERDAGLHPIVAVDVPPRPDLEELLRHCVRLVLVQVSPPPERVVFVQFGGRAVVVFLTVCGDPVVKVLGAGQVLGGSAVREYLLY